MSACVKTLFPDMSEIVKNEAITRKDQDRMNPLGSHGGKYMVSKNDCACSRGIGIGQSAAHRTFQTFVFQQRAKFQIKEGFSSGVADKE